MEKIKNVIYLPKSINREITFMLHNYKNMDKLIDSRKEDLIDKIKVIFGDLCFLQMLVCKCEVCFDKLL